MKPFCFSLQRVLSWRGTLLSLEEAKIEGLRLDLRRLQGSLDTVVRRRTESRARFQPGVEVKGTDLSTVQDFLQGLDRDERSLLVRISEMHGSIEKQQQVVTRVRRDVKLVERLKERRHSEWKAEAEHELEVMAGEFAVTQWRRLQQRRLSSP